MKPRAQLLVLAGLLATAVILLACLPAEEASVLVATPGQTTATPPSEVDEPPTPSPLTPTPAADAGRPDCPQDWAAYADPDGYLSVCYPSDWFATSSLPQAYFGHTLALRDAITATDTAGGAAVTLYWEESSAAAQGLKELCDLPEHWQNVQETTATLAGRNVAICVGDVLDFENPEDGQPAERGTFAEIPVGQGGGFVVLFRFESRNASAATGEDVDVVVQSLRIAE